MPKTTVGVGASASGLHSTRKRLWTTQAWLAHSKAKAPVRTMSMFCLTLGEGYDCPWTTALCKHPPRITLHPAAIVFRSAAILAAQVFPIPKRLLRARRDCMPFRSMTRPSEREGIRFDRLQVYVPRETFSLHRYFGSYKPQTHGKRTGGATTYP